MIFRRSSFLGLSVNDRGITCAEIALAGERRTVRRLAIFPFTAEASLESAGSAGQALASFLREKRFSASHAVVGVPARWLIAAERELPPVAEEGARAMLRLQAERLSAAESGELVCDYVGQSDPNAARKVLLVAMQRQRLEQVENLLESAGITVLAVTSSALALAAVADIHADLPVVLLERQGAELVWRRAGQTRMLRHVSLQPNGGGAPAIVPLGAELGRAVSLAPGGNGNTRELLFWDGVGLDTEHVGQLSARLGFKLSSGDPLRTLGVEAPNSTAAALQEYGPAVSLALAGAHRKLLPIDFKRSRLSPPRKNRLSRSANWGVVAGAAIVLLIAGLYLLVHIRQSELDGLNSAMKAIEDDRKRAEVLVDRVNHAAGWYEKRPALLECLRDVTNTIRDDDRLWVTNFNLREERSTAAGAAPGTVVRRGQIQGKTIDQKYVLSLQERLMKNNKRFSEVKVVDLREAGGRTRDMTFTVSFIYTQAE